MPANILGLDLSLRATGIVVVPERWGLDWSRVTVSKAGSPLHKEANELERAKRLIATRNTIVAIARRHGCTVAVLEQYAFSSMAAQAHALGELGGVVKTALVEAGLTVEVVPPAAARRLLGKQPRKDAKIWAHQKLHTAGAPIAWTGDQLDAFVVVNHYLSAEGGDAVMIPAEEVA